MFLRFFNMNQFVSIVLLFWIPCAGGTPSQYPHTPSRCVGWGLSLYPVSRRDTTLPHLRKNLLIPLSNIQPINLSTYQHSLPYTPYIFYLERFRKARAMEARLHCRAEGNVFCEAGNVSEKREQTSMFVCRVKETSCTQCKT